MQNKYRSGEGASTDNTNIDADVGYDEHDGHGHAEEEYDGHAEHEQAVYDGHAEHEQAIYDLHTEHDKHAVLAQARLADHHLDEQPDKNPTPSFTWSSSSSAACPFKRILVLLVAGLLVIALAAVAVALFVFVGNGRTTSKSSGSTGNPSCPGLDGSLAPDFLASPTNAGAAPPPPPAPGAAASGGTGCLFCRIALGEEPGEKILRTSHALVLRDRLDVAKNGHLLVNPLACTSNHAYTESLLYHLHDVGVLVAAEQLLHKHAYATSALLEAAVKAVKFGFHTTNSQSHMHMHVGLPDYVATATVQGKWGSGPPAEKNWISVEEVAAARGWDLKHDHLIRKITDRVFKREDRNQILDWIAKARGAGP